MALTIGPASAQSPAKRYAAIAVNESNRDVFAVYGTPKSQATRTTYNQCVSKSGNSIDEYCEGTGWVRDGWIALYYEKVFPGDPELDASWGFGWANNQSKANENADSYCEARAKLSCTQGASVQTSRWKGATTGGSW